MVEKRALMMAHVASHIDLFNRDNIKILQELGYKVDVAANFEFGSSTSPERVANFKDELEEQSVRVYHLPVPRSIFDIKNIWASFRQMKKLVDTNHYKIVHCQSPIGGVIARMACKHARKLGTKVIYMAHGFHFFKGAPLLYWGIFYPIEKVCSAYTDVLITINQEDYIRAQRFWSKENIYVPGVGVKIPEYNIQERVRLQLREKMEFKADDFVLMSTGELNGNKNQQIVIQALGKIQNSKIKYIIVGKGDKQNSLKQLTQQLHMEDNIIFTGYRTDVKNFLYMADAFIFPSFREGLSLALMEAMAAKLPVLCSRIRGNVDLIDDCGGFLFNPHDVTSVANSIKKICALSQDELEKMAQYNYQKVKNFDKNKVHGIMKQIYCSLS